MQSGQGGIRWNSANNYIQLMDENKNWRNWSYYNPNTPVSLIPTSINSDSYTRTDGVVINLSYTGNLVDNCPPYFTFKNNNSYTQLYVPSSITIQFSVPQVITSFQFYNYQSSTRTIPLILQRSIDGATYEELGTYNTNGTANAVTNMSISNPAAVKYLKIICNSLGNYQPSNSFLMKNSTIYGYSYSA